MDMISQIDFNQTANPMNPDVKDKWVKALESGEYEQTKRGGLRNTDGEYCCLGVLCEVAVAEGVIPAPTSPEEDERESPWYAYVTPTDHMGATAFLPVEVMEWAGLPSVEGKLPARESGFVSLTSLNDNGHSFEDIAEVVRKVL